VPFEHDFAYEGPAMTITLRPLHLVAIAFLLGLLLTAVVVLALSGGGEGAEQGLIVVTATVDTRTLSTSDAPPTPTIVPVAQAPAAVAPEPQPVRSCAEIRAAGTYLSDVERDYFLGSCRSGATATPSSSAASAAAAPAPAASSPPEPPAPAPVDPAIAEAERAYRARAEASVIAWSTRFQQLPRAVSTQTALLDYGAVAGGWANQMDNYAPVPLRFQRAHDQLQAALRALEAQTRVSGGLKLTTEYLTKLLELAKAADAAVQDYFLVVGLPLPPQ
jgi:hypothetical protein